MIISQGDNNENVNMGQIGDDHCCLSLRIDKGYLRGALHYCTLFLNCNSCSSILDIFLRVLFLFLG